MRPISEITKEILQKWEKIYFGAMPYLEAMSTLNSIEDSYGDESAKHIINYFLANAKGWRGEDARRIKTELKSLIK